MVNCKIDIDPVQFFLFVFGCAFVVVVVVVVCYVLFHNVHALILEVCHF